MVRPRQPHLLAVDHVVVAALDGGRLGLGRIGAGRRLGDAHRLESELAARDAWEVLALLCLGAVAQERAHVVELTVTGAGVGAAAVDLLEDDGRLGEAEAGAVVFGGDERRHPSRLGQRGDECLGIGARFVQLLPVAARELATELAHRPSNVLERFIRHARLLPEDWTGGR